MKAEGKEIEELRDSLDQGNSVDFTKHDYDQRIMAALLIHWLRELPEPLTTWTLFNRFIACKSRSCDGRAVYACVANALCLCAYLASRWLHCL
jgi:hypothetical protein